MIMNAEAWVLSNALFYARAPVPMALAVTAGQLVCYMALFFGGPALLARLPSVQQRLDAFDAAKYQRRAYVALAIGSLTGMPPVIFLSTLSRQFHFRFLPWLAIVCVGRFTRFTVLGSIPETFAAWFGVGQH